MSIASISYSSLKDASGEAKSVAKKLDKYADSLYDNVYKKLDRYDGGWTSNLSAAKNKTSAKISELRSEQSKYEKYANDLIDLRDECKEVDKAVKSRISTLTASFKESHGIRNNWVENAISRFCVNNLNDTAFGRWLNSEADDVISDASYLKASIKEWYNYDGGKEYIKGMISVVLDVVIAIAGVVIAIGTFIAGALTVWAVIVVAAAMIGTAIALQNAWSNWKNEEAAYKARQNGDPATGYRRSDINSYSEYLRSSYIFHESGEYYKYNEYYNNLAFGLDAVNLACSVINLLDSTVNLLKNGFKWATGSSAKLSDINLKRDVFTKKTWSDFKLKLGDIKLAFKSGGLSTFVEYGKFMIKDFGKNFKKEFFDFTDVNGKFDWKGTLGSVKNILGVPKALLDDDLSLSSVLKVGLKNIVLPSLSAFSVNKIDTITGSSGQLKWDFTYDNISLDTIVSFGKDIWDAGVDLEGLFDNTIIGKDVISKLSEGCPLDISIPVIKIPDTNLLILRTA